MYKKRYTTTKSDVSQECKDGSAFEKSINIIPHINRLKRKTHMIISIDAEKAFDKTPMHTHDKNTQQNRNIGKLPQFDKENLQKPTNNIILNGEKV